MADPVAAIISAFGPSEVTTGAIARLREQLPADVPVLVYAGNRAGLDALASVAGSARTVEQAGADGLRMALAECPDGPVLLLHDDVRLGPQAVRRLAAAAAPGRLVVPWLNAEGTDHHLGSLRGERDMGAALRREAARRKGAGGLGRISPAVVLADREFLLAEGVPRHIAAPGCLLGTLALDFHAAAGAVAAHVGECGRRDVGDDRLDGRPLLVATLIVRDEEHMLPDCLASLRGIVDEIVVCDTGSVDATIAVAESFGARVVHRDWRDDFAWARNQAIEAAGDPWYVLVIDADERLRCDDADGLRRALRRGVGEHQVYEVQVTNAGLGEQAGGSFTSVRLFRPDQVRYEGALHEQPRPLPDAPVLHRALLNGLRVVHLGYDVAVVASRDKAERNLQIAADRWERERTPLAALHYARSLMTVDQQPELVRELLEGVLAERLDPAVRSYTLCIMAEYDLREGEHEGAFQRAQEALESVPANDMAALLFAQAGESLERFDAVAERARWRRGRASAVPIHSIPEITAEALAREGVARIRTGDVEGGLADAMTAIAVKGMPVGGWAPLAQALAAVDPERCGDRLWPLIAADSADAIKHLVKAVPPAVTAELAARSVESGKPTADAVEIGLLAAILQRRTDLAGRLLAGVAALDPAVRKKLAERAIARELDAVASGLLADLPAASGATEPLAVRHPRTVVFLEDRDGDARVAAAVARCTAALEQAGWAPVRHVTGWDEPFTRAVLPGGELPTAEATGLVDRLQPAVVVFASVNRLQRDGHALLYQPSARTLLLAPASPFGPGEFLDAVSHPDNPELERVLLDLVEQTPSAPRSVPTTISPVTADPTLTSVVVVDGGTTTVACLQTLRKHTDLPLEIVLVGGDAETLAAVADPALRVVAHPGGGPAALNAGIRAATGAFVCLLDPDYEVAPGWLDALRTALARPRTAAAGGRVNLNGGLQTVKLPAASAVGEGHAARLFAWMQAHADRTWPAPRLDSSCVLTTRALLEAAGGLDEGYETAAAAVADLTDRLAARGALRVADGALLLRSEPLPPTPVIGVPGANRHDLRLRTASDARPATPALAVVLSDGTAAPTRTTVQQALSVCGRVLVLERGDLEATELAVGGIEPGSVDVLAMDWAAGDGLTELVATLPCDVFFVLAAGERLDLTEWESVRAELDELPCGPVRVRIGEHDEVRVHPPGPGAAQLIGSAQGPLLESLRLVPPHAS